MNTSVNTFFLRPAFGLALLLGAALLAGGAQAQNDERADASPPPAASSSAFSLDAGTTVKLRLLKDLSSSRAHVGDHVQAEVADDDQNGLPTGTLFFGHVRRLRAADSRDAGEMDVTFDVQRGDGPYAVRDAASAHLVGREDTKAVEERAKKGAGVGAGLGALIGFAIGHKHNLGDAVGGAILGALGGAAVNAAQKKRGSDVSLKSGDEIEIRLDRPMTLGSEAY